MDPRAEATTEAALRESEALFRSLLEGAPDAIIGVDSEARIVLLNGEAERLFGYSREELVGKPIESLVPERVRETHVQDRNRYIADPRIRPMGAGSNLTGRRKDGFEFPVEISLSPVQTASGLLVMSVVRDVTARKDLERREFTMLRALATIGESAAVLAHEIKNPITAVNTALKSMATKLGLEDREVLGDLVERMRRLEMMMRRTLSFTKAIDVRLARCPASDLFDHAVADSRPVLGGTSIAVETRVQPELQLDVDPQLMREVVANLIINAVEAMNGQGRIILSAAGEPGGDTVLAVEDDGPGMPPSIREKPFRPFVTTKKTGTGLGLSICRKFVEEHGGTITVSDVKPHGTRVEVRLPAEPRAVR